MKKVRSKADFQKTGYIAYTVPGNGTCKPWLVVQWDDGTETIEHQDDVESEW